MAWTNPTTRSTGDLITAAIWNADIVDNLEFLAIAASGLLRHEAGGIEADISAVTKGELLTGTGVGTMGRKAIGTDGHFLKYDSTQASGLNSSAVSAGLTWAGGNTTEATQTSTSAADLHTISSLSITAPTPFEFLAGGRKSSGFADRAGLGWKQNTTVIDEAAQSNALWFTSATDQAEDSPVGPVFITPRVTNYLAGVVGFQGGTLVSATGAQGSAVVLYPGGAITALLLNATMTSLIIRGKTENAGITLGVDEAHVYSRAVS